MISTGKDLTALDLMEIKLALFNLKPLSADEISRLATDLAVLGVKEPLHSLLLEAEGINSETSSSQSQISKKSLSPSALSEAENAKSISLANSKKRWVPPAWVEEEMDRGGADSSIRTRFPDVFQIGKNIFNAANELQVQAYHIAGLAADFDLYAFHKFFQSDQEIDNPNNQHSEIFQHRPLAEIAEDIYKFIKVIDLLTTRAREYTYAQYFSETDSDLEETRLASNVARDCKIKDQEQSIESLKEKVKSFIGDSGEIAKQLEEHIDVLLRALEDDAFNFRKYSVTELDTPSPRGNSKIEDLLNDARALKACFDPKHEASLPSLFIQLRAIFSPESLFPKEFSATEK
jgi:hypothetical protein